jgi:hypothetical protein
MKRASKKPYHACFTKSNNVDDDVVDAKKAGDKGGIGSCKKQFIWNGY